MSARPPVFTWNEELHFGPPSELIHIQTFLDDAEKLKLRGASPWFDSEDSEASNDAVCGAIEGWQEWQGLSEDLKQRIKADCNLDDISSSLAHILVSPKQLSYLQKTHAATVGEFATPAPTGKKKVKPKIPFDGPETEPLKRAMEQTSLRMWKLKPSAKPYIRAGHLSDQNALVAPQFKASTSTEPVRPVFQEVLVTLTSYTRNDWYPYAFSRNSQHILPSNYTLADVWDCVPCRLKGDGQMPSEVIELDQIDDALGFQETQRRARIVGYDKADSDSDRDSMVMVIKDIAYGDGRGLPDYADKLLSHMQSIKPPPPDPDAPPLPPGPYERPKRTRPLEKGPPIHEVPLRSLSLRINEPYWMLHRGNCEHWLVVDEIRLQNPRDPPLGYPITLQRTPTFRHLCRICSKVPASLSILNDIRLGESPAMLCGPCWELLGGPPPQKQDDEPDGRVVVVPIAAET